METSAESPFSEASNPLKLALRRCRGAFWYAGIFSLCINLLTVLFSLYSMQVLDRVFSSRSMETLSMLTLLMGIAIGFLGIFSTVRALVLERVGSWLDRSLSPELLARSLRSSAMGLSGGASQQQRDLGTIRQFIAGAGATTLLDAPWTVVYLLVMFAMSPTLGFIATLGCVLLFALGVVTDLATRKPLEQAKRASLEMLAFADASARQAETIEAMGMLPAMLARWKTPYERHESLQQSASTYGALLQSFTRMVRMALQIAITGIGAYLALHGELTSGGMIASSILSSRAFAPLENAIGFWKQVVMARDARKRLSQSVSHALPMRGEMALPEPKGLLTAEQLTYQTMPGARPILYNLNFALQPGASLGIIGPSGAGKSTLSRLLTGVLPPSAGHLRLDGNEMSVWPREDMGRHLGYLPQQPELFAGTVRDNIARMQANADPQAVIEAAELAGAHHLIQQLPMGYDTVWNTASPSLAPGQKQRIALARAVFGPVRLVVLDEPNLNLDGEGELALVRMIRALKERGVSLVVVAHKPAIIDCLDQVLVLKGGMVEQFGPREAVLQSYIRPAAMRS